MSFNYADMFSPPVFDFLDSKAKSIGSSIGYLVPSMLTATSFLLANSDAHLLDGQHLQPLNLFTMSVGHPGTGKSPAIEVILSALREIDCISKDTLVSSTTSSGLVKTLSKQGKGFIASPELYDILNKLLKNDEENASGDVQLLCKLWSGESASYHFATEATREIEANTAFSILGATQIQNAAFLIFRMDKGHGLLDRFLISVPRGLKPTPEEEEQATAYLTRQPLQEFEPVFRATAAAHKDIIRTYSLDQRSSEIHRRLKTDHVNEVNRAIENGEMPPKSKASDLVARVAVVLSTITHFISCLLDQTNPSNPPEQITEDSYKRAMAYVQYLHSQKELFADFIKTITETSIEKPRMQPTALDIKTAILLFPGRLVTYQAFKKYAPRPLRSVQKQEFHKCAQAIQQYGAVAEVRVPRSAQRLTVFVKKNPAEIVQWPADAPCKREDFDQHYQQPLNKLITANVQEALIVAGHISRD